MKLSASTSSATRQKVKKWLFQKEFIDTGYRFLVAIEIGFGIGIDGRYRKLHPRSPSASQTIQTETSRKGNVQYWPTVCVRVISAINRLTPTLWTWAQLERASIVNGSGTRHFQFEKKVILAAILVMIIESLISIKLFH